MLPMIQIKISRFCNTHVLDFTYFSRRSRGWKRNCKVVRFLNFRNLEKILKDKIWTNPKKNFITFISDDSLYTVWNHTWNHFRPKIDYFLPRWCCFQNKRNFEPSQFFKNVPYSQIIHILRIPSLLKFNYLNQFRSSDQFWSRKMDYSVSLVLNKLLQ